MPSPLGVNTFGIIIMENSNMRFKKWYKAMLFMSATKKVFSAAEYKVN